LLAQSAAIDATQRDVTRAAMLRRRRCHDTRYAMLLMPPLLMLPRCLMPMPAAALR